MNKSRKHDDSRDGYRGDWAQRGEDVNVLNGYITRSQLARQLNKDERTLARWARQRVGPPTTVVGRDILYRIAGVEAWLLQREMPMPRESGKRGRATSRLLKVGGAP